MNIYFATDHAGLELKNELLAYVRDELGHEVEDCGAFTLDPLDDYPPYIKKAVDAVLAHPGSRAIILGGSGQGEAMYANRTRGMRAAVYYGGLLEIVRRSREHNDANVLSIGARFITPAEAKAAVKLWLETEASPEAKYQRRIDMMDV